MGARRAAAVLLIAAASAHAAAAQGDATVFVRDTMIIFGSFIVAVLALFLYLARDSILRRRTDYDEDDLESKRNRDYEKYHSDWQDDYEEYAKGDGGDGGDGQDHYAVLGVPTDATREDIKRRYRALARERHPDRAGGGSGEMARINRAYEVLSDRDARERYDREYFGARGEI